jgi:hypothetical protein
VFFSFSSDFDLSDVDATLTPPGETGAISFAMRGSLEQIIPVVNLTFGMSSMLGVDFSCSRRSEIAVVGSRTWELVSVDDAVELAAGTVRIEVAFSMGVLIFGVVTLFVLLSVLSVSFLGRYFYKCRKCFNMRRIPRERKGFLSDLANDVVVNEFQLDTPVWSLFLMATEEENRIRWQGVFLRILRRRQNQLAGTNLSTGPIR